MEFRRIHASCVHWMIDRTKPEVVAHQCPHTVKWQRVWLGALAATAESKWAAYVGRHWRELGDWRQLPGVVSDCADWISASTAKRARLAVQHVDVPAIPIPRAGERKTDRMELLRGSSPTLRQLKGRYNSKVPRAVEAHVRKWLRDCIDLQCRWTGYWKPEATL